MATRPDPAGQSPQERREPQPPAEGDSVLSRSHAFLEKVVSETNAQLSAPEEGDPAVRRALEEVARTYAGHPLTLEPVGMALVAAVLGPQFPIFAQRPTLLTRTSKVVAETLLADPDARQRLENLWASLGPKES